MKISTEQVEMDPDEQVRAVIRLIFDKYDELGTVLGVFRYLMRNKIRLGIRPYHGPNRGNLGVARRPNLVTLLQESFATPSTRVLYALRPSARASASGPRRGNTRAERTGSPWSSGRF